MAGDGRNFESIVLLFNQLLTGKPDVKQDLLCSAEEQYKKMLDITGKVEQMKDIEIMLSCVRNKQPKAAQNHAHKVQKCINYYQMIIRKRPPAKGYAVIHGKRTGTSTAPPEPAPDYMDQKDRFQNKGSQDLERPNRGHDPNIQRVHEHLNQMKASQEAGDQLRKDNPNVTDLSDPDRPTKLAEKYTELYDNEWTDAFEELQNRHRVNEENVISCLLDILKHAHKMSLKEAEEQFKEMQSAITKIMKGSKASTNDRSSGDKEKPKGNINALRQYRKSLAKLSTERLQNAFRSEDFTNVIRRYVSLGQKELPRLVAYTNKCVELTWFMCVHDPPICLDVAVGHESFDTNRYKPFTKSGTSVDYYVWPPLLLHEGGPLLAKGVAQGR